MKRMNALKVAFFAFASVIIFAQCQNKDKQTASQTKEETSETTSKGIKIAFVDLDSLFTRYEFSITLNKEMLRKEENMRMTLNEKAKSIQADFDDFQRKVQNNVYSTRQRAEEEQNRIMNDKNALDKMQERLMGELTAQSQKNTIELRDSINSFLNDFNKDKKYDLILSRIGENLLYANDALDITNEVIKGLNERYAKKAE